METDFSIGSFFRHRHDSNPRIQLHAGRRAQQRTYQTYIHQLHCDVKTCYKENLQKKKK